MKTKLSYLSKTIYLSSKEATYLIDFDMLYTAVVDKFKIFLSRYGLFLRVDTFFGWILQILW